MTAANVDTIAAMLMHLGRAAKQMPPGWDNAFLSTPVVGPGGQYLGKMLHGRGLYLDMDAKEVGITKPIPHVYQRTSIQRLCDRIRKTDRDTARLLWDGQISESAARMMIERMAVTTHDGIIAARTGKANDYWVAKNSITTTALDYYNMFRIAGSSGPGVYNSATPPTQAAMDRTTVGAWSLGMSNPTAPDKKYLISFGWISAQQINFGLLCDFLVQGGSFRLTVTSAETVASPVTITRDYAAPLGLGAGDYLTFETTTAASATATNLTVTYVDQDGNAGITAVTIGPATATLAQEVWPDSSAAVAGGPWAVLATGDYGVRSFSQTQSSVALAAGVIAGIIARPVCAMPGLAASTYVERDAPIQVDGLTELVTVSDVVGCLSMIILPNGTSSGTFGSFIRSCAG